MVGYTQDDLDAVHAAIRSALTSGVASCSIAGQSVQAYSLSELRQLRAEIASELAVSTASGGVKRQRIQPYYP